MDDDYGEFFAEWQAVSMEDAIWARGRKDCWHKVPYKFRQETDNEIYEEYPEFGTPELPY